MLMASSLSGESTATARGAERRNSENETDTVSTFPSEEPILVRQSLGAHALSEYRRLRGVISRVLPEFVEPGAPLEREELPTVFQLTSITCALLSYVSKCDNARVRDEQAAVRIVHSVAESFCQCTRSLRDIIEELRDTSEQFRNQTDAEYEGMVSTCGPLFTLLKELLTSCPDEEFILLISEVLDSADRTGTGERVRQLTCEYRGRRAQQRLSENEMGVMRALLYRIPEEHRFLLVNLVAQTIRLVMLPHLQLQQGSSGV